MVTFHNFRSLSLSLDDQKKSIVVDDDVVDVVVVVSHGIQLNNHNDNDLEDHSKQKKKIGGIQV